MVGKALLPDVVIQAKAEKARQVGILMYVPLKA
jgi:hypothetical protein